MGFEFSSARQEHAFEAKWSYYHVAWPGQSRLVVVSNLFQPAELSGFKHCATAVLRSNLNLECSIVRRRRGSGTEFGIDLRLVLF